MKKLSVILVLSLLFSVAAAQEEMIENPFVFPDEWTSAAPGEAQMGGQYRTYSISDFDSYNPFTVSSSPDLPNDGMTRQSTGQDNKQNGLVTRNPLDLSEWVPYMAESYEFSEDNTSITFQIRQGMRFSDGEEITADDWVTTFRIHTDEAVGSNVYSDFFVDDDPITVEKLGDYELRINYPAPDAGALSVAAYTPWPDHVFGPVYEEGGAEAIQSMWTLSDDVSTFVSPGPFMAQRYVPGERAVFVRNPYFGTWNVDSAGNQLPYLDGQTFSLLPDINAGLAAYLAGNTDVGPATTVDQIQQIQQAVQGGQLDATLLPNKSGLASSQWIVFNWNRADAPFKQELFRSNDFRHAMSHLADREAMVRLVYGGLGQPIYSGVYPVLTDWQNPDLTTYPYDPERATELLAGLGFTERDSEGVLVNAEGQRLEFNLITNAGNNQREQLAQIFADTAAEVGVRINVRPIAFEVLVEQLTAQSDERGFDAILLGLTGGDIDWPFGSNVIPCGTNLHAFNYPEDGECLVPQETLAEKLYYQGRGELDFETRQQTGYELQEVLSELQGYVQLAAPTYNPTWNNRLGGNYPEEIMTSLTTTRDITTTFIR